MPASFIVACPHCGARNRIPRERWGDHTTCGRCKSSIPVRGSFPDRAVIVSDWNFREEVLDFPGAVMVEFFSPS